jgi:integrase
MATIKKRSNKRFTAEIRKHGQYISRTFDNKAQAMAWAVEAEQTLTPDMLVKGKLLRDLLTRYRDEITPIKKTRKNETHRVNRLMRDSLSGFLLLEIRQTHIDQWIKRSLCKKKSSSVNRDLNLLSAVFEQGIRWEWTSTNPVRGIWRPRNPNPRDRRISEKEIGRIVDALGFDGKTVATTRDIIAVAFLFAIETAMRQGEIWKLTWEDVYINQCFVRLHDTKNGSKRDVPLSPEAVRLLNLLDSHSGVKVFASNQQSSATIFRRCLELAGIKGLTFHDTRHEALTRLARKLEVLDLARMVGHRDPRSLMIYYNATAEEIAARLR